MKKQTVMERYNQQQMMQGKINVTEDHSLLMDNTKHLQKILKQTEESLIQAQQSVRQAQSENANKLELNTVEQRLRYATEQLQQLKTIEINLVLGLPISTQQQLMQLDKQIQQASQTLQLIKSSTE